MIGARLQSVKALEGSDQNLLGHRLALGGMGNGSTGFSITMGTVTLA